MRYRHRISGVVANVSDDRPMGAAWESLADPQAAGVECPDCEFVAKSPAGMAAHARKHNE